LPRIERKKKIKASAKTIYDILEDELGMPIWNLVVNEVKELAPGKYWLNTNVGEVNSTRLEAVPNEKISAKQENSLMTSLGYILTPKDDIVQAVLWAEYDNPDDEMMLGIAGDVFLKSLKKYAEYIETGGKPEDFSKK